jgi:hypothetical protein
MVALKMSEKSVTPQSFLALTLMWYVLLSFTLVIVCEVADNSINLTNVPSVSGSHQSSYLVF